MTAIDDTEVTHRFRLAHERRRFIASCDCGWRSAGALTAGLAGTQFDAHRDAAG